MNEIDRRYEVREGETGPRGGVLSWHVWDVQEDKSVFETYGAKAQAHAFISGMKYAAGIREES